VGHVRARQRTRFEPPRDGRGCRWSFFPESQLNGATPMSEPTLPAVWYRPVHASRRRRVAASTGPDAGHGTGKQSIEMLDSRPSASINIADFLCPGVRISWSRVAMTVLMEAFGGLAGGGAQAGLLCWDPRGIELGGGHTTRAESSAWFFPSSFFRARPGTASWPKRSSHFGHQMRFGLGENAQSFGEVTDAGGPRDGPRAAGQVRPSSKASMRGPFQTRRWIRPTIMATGRCNSTIERSRAMPRWIVWQKSLNPRPESESCQVERVLGDITCRQTGGMRLRKVGGGVGVGPCVCLQSCECERGLGRGLQSTVRMEHDHEQTPGTPAQDRPCGGRGTIGRGPLCRVRMTRRFAPRHGGHGEGK